jgi:hypothetical protein
VSMELLTTSGGLECERLKIHGVLPQVPVPYDMMFSHTGIFIFNCE